MRHLAFSLALFAAVLDVLLGGLHLAAQHYRASSEWPGAVDVGQISPGRISAAKPHRSAEADETAPAALRLTGVLLLIAALAQLLAAGALMVLRAVRWAGPALGVALLCALGALLAAEATSRNLLLIGAGATLAAGGAWAAAVFRLRRRTP